MSGANGKQKRRVIRWSSEAREFIQAQREHIRPGTHLSPVARSSLIARLIKVSGNPRDACLRLLRHIGMAPKRSHREWTKREQQKLLDLIVSMPVEQAARTMGRTSASVRGMLHRLEAGGRQGRDWFTKSSLATALHIRPEEVQRWIDRGWLPCRVLDSEGLRMQIIDPDDFCNFFKEYGRQVVGRRLNYERLWFVNNYVFPPSHADLFSLRENYKKRSAGGAQETTAPIFNAEEPNEEGEFERRA